MSALVDAGATFEAIAQAPSRRALEGSSLVDIRAWASGFRGEPLFLNAPRASELGLAAFCSGHWGRWQRLYREGWALTQQAIPPDPQAASALAHASPSARFDIPMAMEEASLGWLLGACCDLRRGLGQDFRELCAWTHAWAGHAQAAGHSWDAQAFLNEFARGAATDASLSTHPASWAMDVRKNATAIPDASGRGAAERACFDFFVSIPRLAPLAPTAHKAMRQAWAARASHDWSHELRSHGFGPRNDTLIRPFPAAFLRELALDLHASLAPSSTCPTLCDLGRIAGDAARIAGSNADQLAALEEVFLRFGQPLGADAAAFRLRL